MSYINRYIQNPAEILSYDVPFGDFLAQTGDSISLSLVSADPGITIVSSAVVGTSIRIFVAGGVSGQSYEVAVSIVTTGGRTKLGEILIRFRGRNIALLTNWLGTGSGPMTSSLIPGEMLLDTGIAKLDSGLLVLS